MAARRTQGIIAAMARLAEAALSLLRRRKRTPAAAGGAGSAGADAIRGMERQEFEQLVGEGFRSQGFDLREQGGGADLVLGRGQDIFLVQCRHWRAARVDVEIVRALHGAMTERGAAGGFLVTSGQFTDAAKAFAEGRHVRLVDGRRLAGLLRQARESLSGAGASDIWLETRPEASFLHSRTH